MILLYNFLSDMKPRIIRALLIHIPREVESYRRIPKAELKESLEHLYDGYQKLIASGNDRELSHTLRYVVRHRLAQHMGLDSMLSASTCILSVLRKVIQEEIRHLPGDGRLLFQKIFDSAESNFRRSLSLFGKIYTECEQDKHQVKKDFLGQKNPVLDNSHLVIWRG